MSSTRFVSVGLSILVHAALLGAAMLQFTTHSQVELGHDRALQVVEHSLERDRPAQREASHEPSAPQDSPRRTPSPHANSSTSDPQDPGAPTAPPPALRIGLTRAATNQPLPLPNDTAPAALAGQPLPPHPAPQVPSVTQRVEGESRSIETVEGATGDAKHALQRDARSSYAGILHRHISRYKGFPSELSRKGIEGTVLARLTLVPGGRLGTVEILRSSGSERLDRLALEQIRVAAPFPRPPIALRALRLSFLIPMTYSVRD